MRSFPGRISRAGLSSRSPGGSAIPWVHGPHRGVWNLAALVASDEIIVCESLIDLSGQARWCWRRAGTHCRSPDARSKSDDPRRRILGIWLIRELKSYQEQVKAVLTEMLESESDAAVIYWLVSAFGFPPTPPGGCGT